MKKCYIALMTVGISLFFVTSAAHARVALFLTPADATPSANLCSNIEGTWTGVGHLQTVFSDCTYKGTSNISGQSEMTAKTTLKKVSGPDWCKPTITIELAGLCENNVANFTTETAHLSGNTTGKSLTLEGTVNFALNSYLEVDLKKQVP